MEYLKHVLGIHVTNDDCEIESVRILLIQDTG